MVKVIQKKISKTASFKNLHFLNMSAKEYLNWQFFIAPFFALLYSSGLSPDSYEDYWRFG